MWFPRMVAWLSVIAGLLLLAIGLWSLLVGTYLAALQGLGLAFGALIGGCVLLVLLDISDRLLGPSQTSRPLASDQTGTTENPWWMRQRA